MFFLLGASWGAFVGAESAFPFPLSFLVGGGLGTSLGTESFSAAFLVFEATFCDFSEVFGGNGASWGTSTEGYVGTAFLGFDSSSESGISCTVVSTLWVFLIPTPALILFDLRTATNWEDLVCFGFDWDFVLRCGAVWVMFRGVALNKGSEIMFRGMILRVSSSEGFDGGWVRSGDRDVSNGGGESGGEVGDGGGLFRSGGEGGGGWKGDRGDGGGDGVIALFAFPLVLAMVFLSFLRDEEELFYRERNVYLFSDGRGRRERKRR